MQPLFDILVSLITALAAAAFAQFGVILEPSDRAVAPPEVRRTDAESSAGLEIPMAIDLRSGQKGA